MTFTIQIEGISNVLKHINLKEKGTEIGINNGLIDSGVLLTGEVKASIDGSRAESRSYKTGAFFRSINMATGTNEVAVFTDIFYGPFLEWGTLRFPARRHFQNSADRNVKAIIEKIETAIKNNT